jgi:two-component system chemotaxis response regulator CheB
MSRTRVMVVDDSAFVRRALARVLGQDPDLELVGEADNGETALAMTGVLSPDVVLLDLGLPERDGLSVLAELRAHHPSVAVIVVAANASAISERGQQALALGALRCVDKSTVSSMELHALGSELLASIREVHARRSQAVPAEAEPQRPGILVVGASTGGPSALQRLVTGLGRDFPAPVVIVQHMPGSILPQLAQRLSAELPTPGQRLVAGSIYLAPGGRDACVVRDANGLRIIARPPNPAAPHVPGVDALFHSAAEACGSGAWGVLLTGMGRDGAVGLAAIRSAGGLTVAQDAASSAVWGMPRAAFELRAARHVLALEHIAPFLRSAVLAEEVSRPERDLHPEVSTCR